MKVPLVVKMAMKMNAVIATDGPPIQSHHETPRKELPVSAGGPLFMPSPASASWMIPDGSLNQFGPLMPTHDSTLLMAPDWLNRKSHRTVIATELVTDGK